MSKSSKPPIFLASWQAVAYWLSAKPKSLDRPFEESLVAARQNTSSPVPYFEEHMDFPNLVAMPEGHMTSINLEEAKLICKTIGGHSPVHTLGNAPAPKGKTLSYVQLKRPQSLPERCFIQVSDRIFVPTPELALLQIAPYLDTIQLIVLCSLFFGVYGFGPAGSNSTIYRRALCSPKSVRAFLLEFQGDRLPKGSVALRKAVKYAVENTASPAETDSTLRLELPKTLDGYGFSSARHNAKIIIASPEPGKFETRWCDILWTIDDDRRIAVEYESDQEHSGEKRRKDGLMRNNDLLSANIQPFTLLSRHLVNSAEMDKFAAQIGRALGMRPFDTDADAQAKRAKLRAEIAGAIDRFRGIVA